ncbi:MAG: mechanosensitive ion channel [Methanomassiliicoccales archaeon]|nr:MAG: mechanosensitive ion channel [Methanomassiliicoccales archaeon]
MEQSTRKLLKYLIYEFVVFLVLLFILLFIISYYNLDLRFSEIREWFVGFYPKIVGIILIIVITKLVLSFLRPAFDSTFARHVSRHTNMKMMWRFLSNIVWIFVIVLLLLFLIGDIGGLITFGVIVAALLWVLQRPIINVAGWLDIIFHRPYAIGDRVEVDGKKGYVIDVGMFHTTLREFGEWMEGDTFTGRLINIPNSSVFEKPILNYTRDTPYIWDEIKIAITYESDHEMAKHHIMDSALEVVGLDMKKYAYFMVKKMDTKDLRRSVIEEPVVRMEFSESCVNFYVIYFCEVARRRAVRSEITERILDKIKKEKDVRVAYPHMEVVGVKKR